MGLIQDYLQLYSSVVSQILTREACCHQLDMSSKSIVTSFFDLPDNTDEKTSFKVKCKECGTEVTGHVGNIYLMPI